MRRPAAVAAVAALAVVMMSAWGLAARDLAGDELNMLHGNPMEIVQWSLDPRGGFVGHLPWSFWLRWGSLSVFGETPAWAWRLHAVAGGALAAAITGWSASRSLGLGAGALAASLVVFDPVLAFHTQDASNYAWSAAVGAGMLAGLLELNQGHRRGAAILGLALLVGALNDFYAVLVAGPALAASIVVGRAPALRRPVLTAWLTPLIIVLPVVALFAVRLMSSTGEAVVDVHADPIPPRPLPAMLDAPWRVARRVLGAHLHGYAGGRDDSVWIGGPPVLLTIAAVFMTVRGRAWPAAVLVGGALALHGLFGIGLELGAERMLPYEPRSLIGLTPALAVMLAALATRTRPWVGAAVAAVWLLGAGLSTLQARLMPADLRMQAIQAATDQLQDGDALVVPDALTRSRLPPSLQARATSCLDPAATAGVWIANHTATTPPHCGAASELAVWSRTTFDAPVHEGSAASFLPRRIVAQLRPPPPEQAGHDSSRQLTLHRRGPFDGLSAVRWELSDHNGQLILRTQDLSDIQLPSGKGPSTFLSAFPASRSAMPVHPLFSAHHNRIENWEIDALEPHPTVRGATFGGPAMTSLRRLLPLLGLFLTAWLIVPRRKP